MWANLIWTTVLYVVLVAGCGGARAVQHASPIPPAAPSDEALRAELTEKTQEVTSLKGEIDRLRQHENDLTTRLKQALRSVPGKTISSESTKPKAESAPADEATIKQLQEELKRERARRQDLEEQLARLKTETSSPPIPVAALPPQSKPVIEIIPPPELADREPPAPKPVAEAPVAKAPADEPPAAEAPPPAPIEVASIPPPSHHEIAPPIAEPPAPQHVDSGSVGQEVAALRARGVEQETRHQEAMTQLARVLDADRIRQEDLEAQVVSLRGGAPGTAGAVAADSNEVNHLRTRLEEERRRNAELAAKLKLAGRVTDLVFRMQNQAQPGSRPAPAPRVGTQLSQTEPGPNAPNQPYIDPRGEVNQPIDPRERDAGAPAEVVVPEAGGPDGVQVPPVFENQGETITEEVTQD